MSASDSPQTLIAAALKDACREYWDRHASSLRERVLLPRSAREEMESDLPIALDGISLSAQSAQIFRGLFSTLSSAAEALSLLSGEAATPPHAKTISRASKKNQLRTLCLAGGVARNAASLHSDVDLVLIASKDDEGARAYMESLLFPAWDLGLEVGYVVWDVDQALQVARADLRSATMLLDLIPFAKETEQSQRLRKRARQDLFEPRSREILDDLASDIERRHERFGNSPYLLEPEVKNGIGALRDLDVARWILDLCFAAPTLEEAVAKEILSVRESNQLEESRDFLWSVRHRLHHRASRRQDRLTFEDQEEIARLLGYKDRVDLAVEQFMQTYYRHVHRVSDLVERIFERAYSKPTESRVSRALPSLSSLSTLASLATRKPVELEAGIVSKDERVEIVDSEILDTQPSIALRAFVQAVKNDLPVSQATRDAISGRATDAAWAERLRAEPNASRAFLSLLSESKEISFARDSILTQLSRAGLLLAMIPEFEIVTGRVQHDIYHVYTVDVHSIAAVDRWRRVTRGEFVDMWPMTSQLAAQTDDPAVLSLSVLLHDVGKGRGGEHAKIGEGLSRTIAKRLGMSPSQVDSVAWLVREHLSLYHWANRFDLSDPVILRDIAAKVSDRRTLSDLLVLTMVDLATTNPQALTDWKLSMLEQAYLTIEAALTDPDAKHILKGFPDDLAHFAEELPSRYWTRFDASTIRFHFQLSESLKDDDVLFVARPSLSPELIEMTVLAPDRNGLLADIALTFAACRFRVVRADIFTRHHASSEKERAQAVDVFVVQRTFLSDEPLPSQNELKNLRETLLALSAGKKERADLIKPRNTPSWAVKRIPDVPVKVKIDSSISARSTFIEVLAKDEEGLLERIARVFSKAGLTIELARLSTEGARVIDVFYVVDALGNKLVDREACQQIEHALTSELSSSVARTDSDLST